MAPAIDLKAKMLMDWIRAICKKGANTVEAGTKGSKVENTHLGMSMPGLSEAAWEDTCHQSPCLKPPICQGTPFIGQTMWKSGDPSALTPVFVFGAASVVQLCYKKCICEFVQLIQSILCTV